MTNPNANVSDNPRPAPRTVTERELPVSERGRDPREVSVGGLFKQLAHEVPELFAKELALAKAEARESAHAMLAGIGAVATGGAVMLAGLIILLLSATAALALVLDLWLAALIVGIAALVLGLIMVAAGKKQFDVDALKPDRTLRSLRKDQAMAREKTS